VTAAVFIIVSAMVMLGGDDGGNGDLVFSRPVRW